MAKPMCIVIAGTCRERERDREREPGRAARMHNVQGPEVGGLSTKHCTIKQGNMAPPRYFSCSRSKQEASDCALMHAAIRSNSIIRARYTCSSSSSILNSYSDIKTCGRSGHSNSSSNGNIILRLGILRVEVEVVVVLVTRIVGFFFHS